jgi:SAM-dependent methyltransferase
LSTADLLKWDQRYRDGAYSDKRHPTALLKRFAAEIQPGHALDVAAGAGRNSLFLAEAGFTVDALDIADAGLERLRSDASENGLRVHTQVADLEHGIPPDVVLRDHYDLIVMVRYVNMPLIGTLIEHLTDGGVLISEQHLRTTANVVGPRSQAWRLKPNELRDATASLRTHYYREGIVTDPDGSRAALAQVVASRGQGQLFEC